MTTTHRVVWDTVLKRTTRTDLTQTVVWIETLDGEIVAEKFVPAGTTQADFPLEAGEYLERVAATNADGSVLEGTITRSLTVGETPAPATGEVFPLPVWTEAVPPEPIEPEPPEPEPEVPPVQKATWEAGMREWGVIHGDALFTEQSIDWMLNHIYYDAPRVHYQIAKYTGQAEPWRRYAKQAAVFYRDQYVGPNNAAVPGYQSFARGLRLDYEQTGDEASKAAAIALSENAMYAADWTNREYVQHHATSREVAYAILAYIDAEALGEPKRAIRAEWVTQSYDYCRQWQDEANWGTGQISPFMAAITAQALIADWEETQDARCLPALLEVAEFFWQKGYHAATHSLYYQVNPADVADGGPTLNPAPDLNMICAPLYAWLYMQTGDVVHQQRFDELLLGQANAYLAQGKQWDQNYWWAFAGIQWREAGPA